MSLACLDFQARNAWIRPGRLGLWTPGLGVVKGITKGAVRQTKGSAAQLLGELDYGLRASEF